MNVENRSIVNQVTGRQFNAPSIRRSFDRARNTLIDLKDNLPSIAETRRLFSNLALATIATVGSSGLVSADETGNIENQANAECPPGVYARFQERVSTDEEAYAIVVIDSGYQGPQIDRVLFSFGSKDSFQEDTEADFVSLGQGDYERVFDAKHQYRNVGNYEGGAVIKGEVNGKTETLYICFPDSKTSVFNAVDWRFDTPLSAKAGENPSFVFDANQVSFDDGDTKILSRKDPQGNEVGAVRFPGYTVEVEGIGGKRQNSWNHPHGIWDVAEIEFSSTDKQGETSVWWPPPNSDTGRSRPVNDIGADSSITDENVTWNDKPWVSLLVTPPSETSELPDNVAFSIKPPQESYSSFWNGEQWIRTEAPAPEITSMTFGEPIQVYVRPKTVLSFPNPLRKNSNPIQKDQIPEPKGRPYSNHVYVPKISVATSSPR